MKRREFLCATAAFGLCACTAKASETATPMNLLWIVAEDVSPHLGCYGAPGVNTPNLDLLAAEGLRFENAFVTCPVCSPARSALVTGMYQTTLGSHNHRSQRADGRDGGGPDYRDTYRLPAAISLVGDLFRAAGYYVCNGQGPTTDRPGKTDYNFTTAHEPYDGSDWRDAPPGVPFFAQIQLSGGKARDPETRVEHGTLPPYYPDDPVMRRDWAEYLGSVERMDAEMGAIIDRLKESGVYDDTIIVFLTDHGVSHVRGKQFMYEEGIRVPMLMRFPDGRFAGAVRRDMVLHIDLVPTALALAGIPIPEHLHGRDLFAADYQARDVVVSARDRCDETLDTLRCVRTAQYKYIRNFQSFRPHLQYNQYKDGKDFVQQMRRLHEAGELTPLQETFFVTPRPTEELYDLEKDPYETDNLAQSPEYRETVVRMRETLYDWMITTRDMGLFPEPLLEDMGREHGSKYAAMAQVSEEQLSALIHTIEAGEQGDAEALHLALESEFPAQRYWAALGLGTTQDEAATTALNKACTDPAPAVRVAAHLAMCKRGHAGQHLPELVRLIEDANVLVGLYAMNAIEQTGIVDDVARDAAERALASPYDPTRRYGRRLAANIEAAQKETAP